MKKGFTLIEIVLYISLSVIVLSALSLFYISSLQTHTHYEMVKNVRTNALTILDILLYDIEHADSVIQARNGVLELSNATFLLQDGVLYKGQYRLNDESVVIDSFDIIDNGLISIQLRLTDAQSSYTNIYYETARIR